MSSLSSFSSSLVETLSGPFVLKYSQEGKEKHLRRHRIDDVSSFTFKDLEFLIRQGLGLGKEDSIIVRFQDDEDDIITICSTAELSDAFLLAKHISSPTSRLPVLRISVLVDRDGEDFTILKGGIYSTDGSSDEEDGETKKSNDVTEEENEAIVSITQENPPSAIDSDDNNNPFDKVVEKNGENGKTIVDIPSHTLDDIEVLVCEGPGSKELCRDLKNSGQDKENGGENNPNPWIQAMDKEASTYASNVNEESNNESYTETGKNASSETYSSTKQNTEQRREESDDHNVFNHVDLLTSLLSGMSGSCCESSNNTDSQFPSMFANIFGSLFSQAENNSMDPTLNTGQSTSSPWIDFLTIITELFKSESVVSALQRFLSSEAISISLRRFSASISHTLTSIVKEEVDEGKRSMELCSSIMNNLAMEIPNVLPDLVALVVSAPEIVKALPLILKFFVWLLSPKEKRNNVTLDSNLGDLSVVHKDVICDICEDDKTGCAKRKSIAQGTCSPEGYIAGNRFKSSIKKDYDICATCELDVNYNVALAPFLKIQTPLQAPAAICCVIRDKNNQAPALNADRDINWRRAARQRFKSAMNEARRPRCRRPGKCNKKKNVCRRPHFPLSSQFNDDHDPELHNAIHASLLTQEMARVDSKVNESKKKEHVSTTVSSPSLPKSKFIADITLPDASHARAGSKLVKTWRVQNVGTEAWPVGCRLIFVGGDRLCGPSLGVPLPNLPSGESTNISVDITAPSTPGRYVSYWKMVTPDNIRFGSRFWIDLSVSGTVPEQIKAQVLEAAKEIRSEFAKTAKNLRQEMANSIMSPSLVKNGKWGKEIKYLLDMGFEPIERVTKVINEVCGNVSLAVEKLCKG